ncbi:DNA repair helicase component of transcription factor b (nucleomorph) [Chroomonas mesostigmatica CCMP1168]|uniref:DNA repair helicase component of transcription factor b n=1 Tax=Chroomonas mesostigmatica CCMP1168 TaxID=1195612 RepID=J7G6K4_9CRYP|nr:DNA repair helicase component of transcription factor b [Chroomonas mesostigmatica CCMP1168]
MQFYVQNLCVYFPYKIVFPEQIQYMYILKKIFDKKKHGITGIPPGMGFCLTTISFFISYNFFSKKKKKLIYCLRRENEIECAIAQSEMFLSQFTVYSLEKDFIIKPSIMALYDKTKLCLNPIIKNDSILDEVEDFCHSLLSPYFFSKKKETFFPIEKKKETGIITNNESKCFFFTNYIHKRKKIFFKGIWTIFKLRNFGIKKNFCSFFLSKDIFVRCDVVISHIYQIFFSETFSSLNKKLTNCSFLIFDNIFDLESLNSLFFSVNIDPLVINDCQRGIFLLKKNFYWSQKISIKKKNFNFFFIELFDSDSLFSDNIKKVVFWKNFFNKNKKRLNFFFNFSQQKNKKRRRIQRIFHNLETIEQIVFFFKEILTKTIFQKWDPIEFVNCFLKKFFIYETSITSINVLVNFLSNLFCLLGFFNFRKMNGFSKILEFLKLIWINSETYNQNFIIFFSLENHKFPLLLEPCLEIICTETCLLFKSFFENFSSVIIISNNLSNLPFLFFIIDCKPKIFGKIKNFFEKNFLFSVFFNIKISNLLNKMDKIKKKKENQNNKYSIFLNKIIENIPEGIVCIFPSKFHIEETLEEWNKEKFLNKIFKKTKIFFENADILENLFFFDQYKLCCDFGIKALFISIYGGFLSKANLSLHFSRAFLLIEPDKIGKNSRLDLLTKKSIFFNKANYFYEFRKFYVKEELGRLLNKHFKSKKNFGVFFVFGKNKKFFEDDGQTKFWKFKTSVEKNNQIKHIIKKIRFFFLNKYINF